MTTAIRLQGVSKHYAQLTERGGGLRSWVPALNRSRTDFHALRGVDLEIGAGETVGLIGRNGAGKTSLLRLLAGVSRPSEGTVTVHGRIAPLLSVGVGFHQEMSGRENVYVNGMLLGLTKREVDERLEQIVAFAELEDAIDGPVKFYSSGMYMRLGFAVAIHVNPDVLLIDEVLAVGDLAFQLKCFDRMRELKELGTTIVMVSHSMHAIRLLCPRALLLDAGRVVVDGSAEEVIARHHELLSQRPAADGAAAEGQGHLLERTLRGRDGAAEGPVQRGRPAVLRYRFEVPPPHRQARVRLRVLAEDRTLVYAASGPVHDVVARGAVPEVGGEIDLVLHVAGGTLRFVLSLESVDGTVLYEEAEGLLVYLAPALGTSGVGDVGARIAVDGTDLTDHRDVLL